MTLSNITIESFLTSTAVAYMLLMIGILLLANFVLKTSPPKSP